MPTIHSLEPDLTTLHGYFSRERAPILTIDPGDTVRFRTLEANWRVELDEGSRDAFLAAPRFPGYDPETMGSGHSLVGPVAIRGAKPGMTLAVRIDEVVPTTWGYVLAGGWQNSVNERYGIVDQAVVHRWTLNTEQMIGRNQHGHSVALRPFMGVMGLPPDEAGRQPTPPPRFCGGNLDCKELVAGSTLYLPVTVDGALFSTGDGHAVQGDGEVSITAIECGMERVDLTFDVLDDFLVTTPTANTPAGWLTMGIGDTLDDATYMALEAMFALMERQYGLAHLDAIALASLTVDLHVTQIVNGVVGVHAILPHGAFR